MSRDQGIEGAGAYGEKYTGAAAGCRGGRSSRDMRGRSRDMRQGEQQGDLQ